VPGRQYHDLLLFATTIELRDKARADIRSEWEVTDLGEPSKIVGIEINIGVSTVSVFTGIRAPVTPVIRVPSPSRLASKQQFDGTGYGTVTPRIRPSSDGRIRPYDGREGSLTGH